ncbi:ABC transporter substrate-binding protein [Granulosicoccus antarcticus]|uniref:Erythritol/L-threitol-binding protein n=1 Tax=Granulosicoccus antarcticus IMCC3135 TaxID=1192854 RepID=A0A2Z2NQQ2_9GAMM|nr:sugar ABC transporter substrate-binding protein [Granulosicoccus antarcticus]ASJ73673.1 Erythritol/L-threitol-binding protein [Granulosicoccus antarcticus IMCC3135]
MMNSIRISATSIACLAFSATLSTAVADTITIATVDNGDMVRMQALTEHFTKDNPDTTVEWVTLDENTLRQRATTDIATGGGQFDVVTIGTYEASIWAERGWLMPLDDLPGNYDIGDLLPPIRSGLSHDGVLFGAPFYGESSFTMYRTDLFEQAGLEMPDEPTWDFIKEAANTLTDRDKGVSGICLRGKAGWGENMALLTSMANSYGASWFDMDWKPQLDSEAWNSALTTYADLLKNNGPVEASTKGYQENLALFQQGQCAIWIDATAAGQFVTNKESTVADSVGFAMAPDNGLGKRANWLWAWALAIPQSTDSKESAKKFVAWATSKEYLALVAETDGWASVPPGTRKSLYENPEYQKVPFAAMTLASIEAADPTKPTVEEVPYTGVQFVAMPEFTGIATAVGQQFANVLEDAATIEDALKNSQWVTEKQMVRVEMLNR